MGNVMTGRQVYGEYENTDSKEPADHVDDPLAELARIVSEGDEYLRQQRQEYEESDAVGAAETAPAYSDPVPAPYQESAYSEPTPDDLSGSGNALESEASWVEQGAADTTYFAHEAAVQGYAPDGYEQENVAAEPAVADWQQTPDYQTEPYVAEPTSDAGYVQSSPEEYAPAPAYEPAPVYEQEQAQGNPEPVYETEPAFEEEVAYESVPAYAPGALYESEPAYEQAPADPYQPESVESQAQFAPLPEIYGEEPLGEPSLLPEQGQGTQDYVTQDYVTQDYASETPATDTLSTVADPYQDGFTAEAGLNEHPAFEPEFQYAVEPHTPNVDLANALDQALAAGADFAPDSYATEFQDPSETEAETFAPADYEPAVEIPLQDSQVQPEYADETESIVPQIHLDAEALLDPRYDAEDFSAALGVGGDSNRIEPESSASHYEVDQSWEEEDPYTIDPRDGFASASFGASPSDGQPQLVADPVDMEPHFSGQSEFAGADQVGLNETIPPVDPMSSADPGQAISAAGPTSRSLGLKAMAAVIALIVLGGGGLFAYRTFGGSSSAGTPPVIKADTKSFKEYADTSSNEAAAPKPGSGVYQRLSGANQSDKSQERIVVGREQPVTVARNSVPGANEVTSSTLPRPVKTIVVKPDGTFVSRPDPQPDQAPKRVAAAPKKLDTQVKSNARVVSTTPIRTVTTDRALDTNGNVVAAPSGSATKPAAAVSRRAQSAADTIANANPQVVTSLAEAGLQGDPTVTGRAPDPSIANIVPITVKPRSKPAISNQSRTFVVDQSTTATVSRSVQTTTETDTQTAAVAVTQPAVPAPVKAAPVQAAPAPAKGRYIVQVSSQRSRKQAQSAYANLQRRYPSVLENVPPLIQKADLGDRGTYYRVRLGPFQQQAATKLCGSLISAGGECFVRRN